MSIIKTTLIYYQGEQGQVYVEPFRESLVETSHIESMSQRLKHIWNTDVTVLDSLQVKLYSTQEQMNF